MKKFTLLAGIYFAGISFAFSQSNSAAGPKLLNNLKMVCNLTSQQLYQLQPIVAKHVETLQAAQQKYSGAALQKADNTENLKFNTQLKGILSPAQMNSLKNSNK